MLTSIDVNYKRQQLRRIFLLFPNNLSLSRLRVNSCPHAGNIPHELSKIKRNAKHLFQSWENLISNCRLIVTPTEQDREPVFCFVFG